MYLDAQNDVWCDPISVEGGNDFQIYDIQTTIVNGNPASVYVMEDAFGSPSSTNGEIYIKYVRATDSEGTTWGTPILLATGLNNNDGISVAIINGNPAVAYHDRRGGGDHSLRYIRANDVDGSTWGSIVTIESGTSLGQFCSLTTINGNPGISHYNSSSRDLRYSSSSDVNGIAGSWTSTLVDSDNAGSYSTLLEVQGNPAISYLRNQAGTVGDAKYIRATNTSGTNWGSAIDLTTSLTSYAGRYISMAIVNGNPAVCFNDYENNPIRNATVYVRATDNIGSSWGTLQNLVVDNDEDNQVIHQSLAVINGVPAIAFHPIEGDFSTYTNITRKLRYITAMNASGSGAWNSPVDVTTDVVNGTQMINTNNKASILYINSNAFVKYVSQEGCLSRPELDVRNNADDADIADASTTITTALGTDFGSVAFASGSQANTFRAENNGTGTLTFDADALAISNTTDFSITTDLTNSGTVATSGVATFTITFDPASIGMKTATVTILSDDADEDPYTFLIQGTGTAPELDVRNNADDADITDASTSISTALGTNFGNTCVSGGTASMSFRAENNGTGSLTLGADALLISGVHAGDFSITTDLTNSGTLAESGVETFTVEFNPIATGTRTATVTIRSNDANEDPYTFEIQGVGINPIVTLTATTNSVAEDGVNNLVYRFARDCSVNALTVNFSVDSQSTANTADYTVTTGGTGNVTFSGAIGTITFPAGATTVDLTINPDTDIVAETDETVVIKIENP